MIGIYKITNKINNKAYIGQSIHCGKRLDEHCKGSQFIDEVIQLEGIENFTFEVLKEVMKEELSYWEDYYIIKYKTMFPDGYNKKWNCKEKVREEIREQIKLEAEQANNFNKENFDDSIVFPSSIEDLRQLEYNDDILAWWILHFENKAVQKSDFTYKQISQDIGISRQTASSRFQNLINKKCNRGFLIEKKNNNSCSYALSYLNKTQLLNKKTVKKLLEINKSNKNEELIKTLVYILEKKQQKICPFTLTVKEILTNFGHSIGNITAYNRIRNNLDILQGAGIIKFKTVNYDNRDGMPPQMYVYYVADEGKASDEWLGIA